MPSTVYNGTWRERYCLFKPHPKGPKYLYSTKYGFCSSKFPFGLGKYTPYGYLGPFGSVGLLYRLKARGKGMRGLHMRGRQELAKNLLGTQRAWEYWQSPFGSLYFFRGVPLIRTTIIWGLYWAHLIWENTLYPSGPKGPRATCLYKLAYQGNASYLLGPNLRYLGGTPL